MENLVLNIKLSRQQSQEKGEKIELTLQMKTAEEERRKFAEKNNYSQLSNINQSYEKELARIEILLEHDNSILASAIKGKRGHSEDYLHYFLKNGGIADIQKQIPPAHDRVYLVISSTKDACDRCFWKVEEMVDMVTKSLAGRARVDIEELEFKAEKKVNVDEVLERQMPPKLVCKALYFATDAMRDKELCRNNLPN